jgi:hypothetical protein
MVCLPSTRRGPLVEQQPPKTSQAPSQAPACGGTTTRCLCTRQVNQSRAHFLCTSQAPVRAGFTQAPLRGRLAYRQARLHVC